MAKLNRWLLPEGVEEILPKQAWQIEQFKRQVLDLYRSWGYELVIPPLIEYSESLLIGMGSEMDVQSFKVTDQLSGRTLAIRADITPQTARIDAHSYKQEGPTRLCYAATVLHSKPKSQLASRTPIEVGAELYGDASVHSDFEIISLMLATIKTAGIDKAHLDIGHVAIYRSLVDAAGIDEDQQVLLFDAFDRKAKAEVAVICAKAENADAAAMIVALIDLHGDSSVLNQATAALAKAPAAVIEALEYLKAVVCKIESIFAETPLNIDLSELRGYDYHTGLVFAAYVDGIGHSVANGGRYDGIGEHFGRARPATGFSASAKALLSKISSESSCSMILAPALEGEDIALEAMIQSLRERGEAVVRALPGADVPVKCDKELVNENGQWQVKNRG
ncbi:MAG: ATP phosphoribosyltransferase regulatory subunit [Pseudomonadales bacterium]|nr:ATP phosphoribosyltransferase regulatory subunit [Pseudomonadales bacterium]